MTSSPKRPTVADVARKAGVSKGTVSAVLNRKPTVATETRTRVVHAIDALGYRPRGAAFLLGAPSPTTAARSVGVVVKEDDNPYYADVVAGVRDGLADAGLVVSTSTSEGDYAAEGRLIDAFRQRRVEGLIVAPVVGEASDLSHLFRLQRAAFPFVLLEAVVGLRVPSVTVDNAAAAEAAARHLLDGGHERVVHVSGPRHSLHSRDRVGGVQRAFSRSALRFHDGVVVPGGARLEDGYRAALDLFGDAPADRRPTGVTCFNDLVAIGVLRALAELGLDVPGDVSVVGFDDVQVAAYLSVPLTTVRVPKREIGRCAAALLLNQLDAGDRPLSDPKRVVLETDLVQRGSTRPL